MAFGTAIAALDVVLGIAGLDTVLGGMRSLDREMARQQQRMKPQQIRLPGVEDQIRTGRALSSIFASGSQAASRYERSLANLQRAIATPTRNYGAARQAMQKIQAADVAKVQIQQAQEQVARLRAVQAQASADVQNAGLGVTNAVAGVRQARSDLAALVGQEKALRDAFTQSESAAKKEAATLTRLRAQQVSDTNKVAAAERALLKQQQEISVRQARASKPLIEDEFSKTVTGQRLYERRQKLLNARSAINASGGQAGYQAAGQLAGIGRSLASVDKQIKQNLIAREAAHKIAIDGMIRQEHRYQDALTRTKSDLTATTGALQVQRGTALQAIAGKNQAAQNLAAFGPQVAQGRAGLTAAEQALTTARAARLNAIGMRQQATAAVQTAIASARMLSQQLAPVIAEGGANAVAAFRNAMTGLNPAQWLGNVLGAAGGAAKSIFQAIGQAGQAAFSVLSFAGNLAWGVLKTGMTVISAIGSGLMGIAKIAGNVGSAILSFVASPLVATPLTGGLNLIIDHLGTIIKLFGGAAVAAAAFGAQQVMSEGITYEKSVSGVRAAAGYSPGMGNNPAAVEEQIRRLNPIILQIGAETQFNNAEVAEGIANLLRGGLSVTQMNYTIARSLFDLSAATGASTEDSARVVDGLVQLFKVPEDQIVHMTDVVAGAVNSSLINVSELGSAIRQLGPLAQTMGITPEDTITALTMLAGAGFKGELGGTALRNMLIYLNPRSNDAIDAFKDAGFIDKNGKNQFFDAKGNMKSLPDIFALLRGAAQNKTNEEQLDFFTTIFGTRSASAAEVYAGIDPAKFGQTKARIGQQSARGTADTMLDNVAGKWEILTGSLQSLAAVVYMNWLSAPLKRFLDWGIGVANKLFYFVAATDGMTDSYKEMFGEQSRAGAFLGIIRQFIEAGSFLSGMNLTDLQIGLEAIFTSGKDAPMTQDNFRKYLVNPIIQVIRAVQLGRDAVITFSQAIRGEWGGKLTQSINPVVRLIGIFGTYWGNLYRSIRDIATGKISLKDFLGQLSGGFGQLLLDLGANIDQEGPGIMTKLKGLGTYLKDTGKGWWDDYLHPEVDYLWGQFTGWLVGQKPMFVSAWNNLWNSVLGIKPDPTTNPIEGLSLLGTDNVGPKAEEQLTSLGTIFGVLFDKGQDVITSRGGPMLDKLLEILQGWWKEHKDQVFTIGKNIGQSFVDGLTAAIENTIGPDWIQKLLIKMGASKEIVDFLLPPAKTGGTAPGVFGGTVTTRDPNGTSPGQAADNAVKNFFGGIVPKTKGILDWIVPPKPGMKGADGNIIVAPPGARDDWWNNPTMKPQPGAPPTTSPDGSYTPPAGTMPLGMPRVGEGGAAAAAAALAGQAAGSALSAVLAEAMVPRQININGTGLTPSEFYQELGGFLEQFFSGRTSAPVGVARGGNGPK